MDNNDVRLSLSWRNVANFDDIKRLKFLHRFNNQTIKDEIFSRQDPNDEHYFIINSQLLSIYSVIPKEERMIGVHSLELFFSFDQESDMWLSFFGDEVTVNITREHLDRVFALEDSTIFELDPITEEDKSVEIITDPSEYFLFNKYTNEDIFNHAVRIVKMNNNSFKLYNKDVNDSVKWLSLNEEDGSISWVDTFDEGIALNRVSIPNDLNGEFIVLMSDSGYVLYKTESETPKFGKLSEVTMNDSEIAFATDSEATMIEPEGGKEIRYTREERTAINPWGRSSNPFDECNTNCLSKPTCVGADMTERGVSYTQVNILYDNCAWNTPFTGTLTGGAIRDTSNRWILLSDYGVGDSIRTVYWSITLPRIWTCTFNWFKGDGSWGGADEVRFIFYAPNPITTLSGKVHGGHCALMEYWQQDTFGICDSNDIPLTISDVTWANNVWHPVTVTFDNGNLTVEVNNNGTIISRTHDFGTQFEDLGYYDNPTYVGFSGRTGGITDRAYIKDISIYTPPGVRTERECVYYHNESGEKDLSLIHI